jgi:integrase
MKRQKTKHKGIYRRGNHYYVVYNDGTYGESESGERYPVRREKRIEGNLDTLKFKVDMEEKISAGKASVVESMRKTTFRDLMSLCEEKGEGKRYILLFEKQYLEYFGDRKLSSITRRDLFNFRDKVKETPKQRGGREVKDSTVNRAMHGLSRLFSFGVAMRCLEESPFPQVSKTGLFFSEKKGLRNFFTEKELIQILSASPEWLRSVVVTLYLTGIRLGELLKLRWDYVDLEAGIIYLPSSKTLKDETERGQKIVMQKKLISLFEGLPKNSEWVFTNANGLPYNHWEIHRPFKAILKSLEIDETRYSLKDIRHTTGSLMNLRGAPPMAIRDQLRHASFKTTEDFYIGSDNESQRAEAEKLVFDELPIC